MLNTLPTSLSPVIILVDKSEQGMTRVLHFKLREPLPLCNVPLSWFHLEMSTCTLQYHTILFSVNNINNIQSRIIVSSLYMQFNNNIRFSISYQFYFCYLLLQCHSLVPIIVSTNACPFYFSNFVRVMQILDIEYYIYVTINTIGTETVYCSCRKVGHTIQILIVCLEKTEGVLQDAIGNFMTSYSLFPLMQGDIFK